MSNPHRGETALVAGGATYTLKYSLNALCELEDALGMPIAEMAAAFDDPSKLRLKHLRTVIWAGLREHRPDVTEEEAGRIADEAGIAEAAAKVGEAFQAAFPDKEKGDGAGRPKKALR